MILIAHFFQTVVKSVVTPNRQMCKKWLGIRLPSHLKTLLLFMHFFSIEFRANIFILMDIMIFHIIIQKIISLVFIIGFSFSLIFISHFQIQIIFINGFSSSISYENSILNTSHFSFQLIFINDFFIPFPFIKMLIFP